jgi:hypothetical protein
MTVLAQHSWVSNEVERAVRVIAPANAFFLSRLARIVDITKLSEGDAEYDYFVRVPAGELHKLDQRIEELRFDVEERFGVRITIMPIAVAA